jgi:BNR repeat-like domain
MLTILLAMLVTVRIAPDMDGLKFSQPQIAVAGDLVGLTFGSSNNIYYSGSRDQGRTFSKPMIVATIPKAMLGMHRGPRIAISSAGTILISAPQSGNIVGWRSSDGGRTWSASRIINDSPGSAPEGLQALATGPNGLVFAAWLDFRENRRNQLYGAASTDGGVTWSKNVRVYASPDGKICECCHPSLAISKTGEIYVMWRNNLDGARDLYFARSMDRGKTFNQVSKFGTGTWQLNICPMDGGGVAVDAKGEITSVWRRQDTVFLSRPGQPERALAIGKDPTIAVNVKGPYVVWTGRSGLHAKLPHDARVVTLAPDGAFATIAGSGSVFAAWESQGAIVVTRLDQ